MDVDTVYNKLALEIVQNGKLRENRTGVNTIGTFGKHIEIDISVNAPLLTSKRVPWKSCIHELIWFLNGSTFSPCLERENVNIWKSNSTRDFLDKYNCEYLNEGDCGPIYGHQWRKHGSEYYPNGSVIPNPRYEGIDQIQYISDLLQNDPYSRRMYMTAWNPSDIPKTPLPPCHVSAQFYVENENDSKILSCHVYQRSCDVFLGLPWNIFSYYTLTKLFATNHNMKLGKLHFSFGDVHIYNDHINSILEQINRPIVTEKPILNVNNTSIPDSFYNLDISRFEIVNYNPHPSIKGQMAV